MANQKISQLTAITSLASGDYFPVVQASGTTNKRVGVDVLDNRYYLTASGAVALSTANQALASGNAALASAATAQASGNAALASGNAALSSAALKLPLSGGVVSGQFAQNIVPLGLYGSGINTGLGNYFTAILSGNASVVISGAPSSVSYGFTYEVNHQTGTITWPAAVVWPSATAPTLTTGKTHLFMFVTDDSGTTWRASSLINYNS
jgi:hypothetical protein